MSGEDPPLPVVALADVVRLRVPYQPIRGQDRQVCPFGFGIVAELLTVLPDGRVRNASLYLYDPARRELFLGPNGIPEFVDCHGSEFELLQAGGGRRLHAPRPPTLLPHPTRKAGDPRRVSAPASGSPPPRHHRRRPRRRARNARTGTSRRTKCDSAG